MIDDLLDLGSEVRIVVELEVGCRLDIASQAVLPVERELNALRHDTDVALGHGESKLRPPLGEIGIGGGPGLEPEREEKQE